jgi:hypothetical protein
MLQAWLSIGYVVLLAILVLTFAYGAGALPLSPSLLSCWVCPSGLDGNICTSNMDDRAYHGNGSVPQRSRRAEPA